MTSFNLQPEVQEEYKHWMLSQIVLTKVSNYLKSKGKPSDLKAGLENTLMNLQPNSETYGQNLFLKIDSESIKTGFSYVNVNLNETETQHCEVLIKDVALSAFQNKNSQKAITLNSESFKIGDFEIKRNPYVDKAFYYVKSQHSDEIAANAIIKSALRYATIYAKTRHIGPPQKAYDLFYDWGVRNEGFASPFNARLLGKPNAQFHSLFKDTDEIFGSAGSFFTIENPTNNSGYWCLDPPFTKELMSKVDPVLKHWLTTYNELKVLLIVPESYTPQNIPDETVTLKKDRHYYEGLDGLLKPLPVNVCVHRYGDFNDFSAEAILEGYSK